MRDDFLMRQIQQFAGVLSKILSAKKANDSEQFVRQLDNLSSQFLGFDLDMLHTVSFEDTISLFAVNENIDLSRCFIAAEILREECVSYESENDPPDTCFENYLKSFLLYFESVSKLEELQNKDTFRNIESVINKISQFQISSGVKIKMFRYFEISQNFAAAENVLHELLENDNSSIQSEAESFYSRLLEKSDEELEKGNLPRDEVLEGLRTTRKIML